MANPEHRVRCHFAWLPVPLDDGRIAWLADYWAVEVWEDDVSGWSTRHWSIVGRFATQHEADVDGYLRSFRSR